MKVKFYNLWLGRQESRKHSNTEKSNIHWLWIQLKTNNIDPEIPLDDKIPDLCAAVALFAHEAGLVSSIPDQLDCEQVPAKAGIPLTDTHDCCTDTIVPVPLGQWVTMEFRGPKGEHIPVWLPQICWWCQERQDTAKSHGITPRLWHSAHFSVLGIRAGPGGTHSGFRDQKVSLTFRKLKVLAHVLILSLWQI